MLVRLLNPRANVASGKLGFLLGTAKTLIGNHSGIFSLTTRSSEHSFVCGRTGSGKTTLLMRLMAEHLRLRIPFLFSASHGQATDELLGLVAGCEGARPFVLVEPWSEPVIGWNPLSGGEDGHYSAVQELIAIFHRKLWPDAWGPRLEECLRCTLLA